MLTAFGLDLAIVENKFTGLKNDVNLLLFQQEAGCVHCHETKRLMEKLASITHKINLDVFNFAINKEMVSKYNIKRVPALVLTSDKDYGIRYYSFPKGAELYNFLDDIVEISNGDVGVSTESKERLARLQTSVQLEYFISPSCPFSWTGEKILLRLAMSSDLINLDIIDVADFLEIAESYQVRGIPMTVVNGKGKFYGALTEKEFVDAILENVE